MENDNFAQHALLKNRYYRFTIPLTTIIALASLIIIDSFCHRHFSFRSWQVNLAQLYIEIIPVMLLTFLSGYSAGSVVVLLFFSVLTLKDGMAYHCFMLLLSSLLMDFPIYRRWFLSLPKTLLADVLLIIVMGPGWNILLGVLQGSHSFLPRTFTNYLFLIGVAAPSCTLVCALCYCYHRFLPQRVKNLFFATTAASELTVEFRKRVKEQKRPKISTKIIVMIVGVTLMLLVSSYGISTALYTEELNFVMGISPEDAFQRFYQADTFFGWRATVFATRMFTLMLIVAVPAVLVAVEGTKSMISNPLILMTMALEDSAASEIGKAKVDIRDLNITSRDEIGIFYGALLHSYDVLDEYIKEVEREKQLTNDLTVAKEANKAKDVFLSSMSHEIRTPINAVLGLDEIIIRETKEDEIKQYALDIQSAGRNLLSIVNKILDFSKIEAGRMEIIPVEYDLSSTINDMMNMVTQRAADKGLALNLRVDETIPHLLEGDEQRIKQCAVNILTNAVKYTQKGSVTMKVSWSKIDDNRINLTFHIIDTGIGIKEEDLPSLFTAFKRIEEKRNRTIEGTGLGMSIVQNLLQMMDSTLYVDSVYGKGSDFYFTVEQKVVSWTPLGNIAEGFRRSRMEASARKEAFHAPSALVLVVDDTPLNLTVARGLLKRTLVQVETAESGPETLKMVQQKKYDLIFLDHRMPMMDGIETLAAMRTLEGNLNLLTPCIALTANAIVGAQEMYLEAGFSDYLTKPIDSEKMEKLMLHYLPEEKVELVDSLAASGESEDDAGASDDLLAGLEGIDIPSAIANCGGREVLLDAMHDFYVAVDSKSALIEKYAAEKDWKNYTVLVHALKSSSRLIGVAGLSAAAARLELCGDVAGGAVSGEAENLTQEQAEQEIAQKTPALLEAYRACKVQLEKVVGAGSSGEGQAENQEKPAISKEDFDGALSSLKECVQAFDFSTADQIISMLDGYQIPDEEKERFLKIREKVSAVDQGEILKLL